MENKLLCRCWKWSLQIKNRRGKEPLAEKGTPERLKLKPNKLKKTRENANLRKRKHKERSEKKWLQTMWNRLSGNDVCWEETKQQCNSTNHLDCVWKMVGMLKRKIIREKGWAAEKEERKGTWPRPSEEDVPRRETKIHTITRGLLVGSYYSTPSAKGRWLPGRRSCFSLMPASLLMWLIISLQSAHRTRSSFARERPAQYCGKAKKAGLPHQDVDDLACKGKSSSEPGSPERL